MIIWTTARCANTYRKRWNVDRRLIVRPLPRLRERNDYILRVTSTSTVGRGEALPVNRPLLLELVQEFGRQAAGGRHLVHALPVTLVLTLLAPQSRAKVDRLVAVPAGRHDLEGLRESMRDLVAHPTHDRRSPRRLRDLQTGGCKRKKITFAYSQTNHILQMEND